jgi:hypothetical protein
MNISIRCQIFQGRNKDSNAGRNDCSLPCKEKQLCRYLYQQSMTIFVYQILHINQHRNTEVLLYFQTTGYFTNENARAFWES